MWSVRIGQTCNQLLAGIAAGDQQIELASVGSKVREHELEFTSTAIFG